MYSQKRICQKRFPEFHLYISRFIYVILATKGCRCSATENKYDARANNSMNAKKRNATRQPLQECQKQKGDQQWCNRNRRDVNNRRTSATAELPTTA